MRLKSYKEPNYNWITTPAASSEKIITLKIDQQEWLHKYYFDTIPEYHAIVNDYNDDKVRHIKLRKKSQFPSKQEWTPPMRQLTSFEQELLCGPSPSCTLLKKVQFHVPKIGRWITYSSKQFEQSSRVSSSYVCIGKDGSSTPQFGCISKLISHDWASRTEIFVLIDVYSNPSYCSELNMWFTSSHFETSTLLSIKDISQPLVIANDEKNAIVWYLNFF